MTGVLGFAAARGERRERVRQLKTSEITTQRKNVMWSDQGSGSLKSERSARLGSRARLEGGIPGSSSRRPARHRRGSASPQDTLNTPPAGGKGGASGAVSQRERRTTAMRAEAAVGGRHRRIRSGPAHHPGPVQRVVADGRHRDLHAAFALQLRTGDDARSAIRLLPRDIHCAPLRRGARWRERAAWGVGSVLRTGEEEME